MDFTKPGVAKDDLSIFTPSGSRHKPFEFWWLISYISACEETLEHLPCPDGKYKRCAKFKDLKTFWKQLFCPKGWEEGV